MTDFAAPSSPEIGSQFDVTNLDESVRAISAVESQWRLPQLPDSVKLDLASSPELGPQQATEFLVGLDRDYADEDDEFGEIPEEPEQPPLNVQLRQPAMDRSGLDNLRVIGADILGAPAPTQPDIDAVAKFKMRAIERGLLDRPQNGVVDTTWNRGLNSVFYDMAYDDYQQRLSGDDSIDSMSTRTAIDMIAEWTQPGHLVAAAMDLDLLPDFGAIASETTNWLEKWRDVGKSKNPFDFGKNLIDAALGPIDDIAMPILTWAAILGTGGSATVALAPKGFLATKIGRAAVASRELPVIGRFGAASGEVLAETGLLARRLQKSTKLAPLGKGMEAWRAATPVVKTKQVLQPAIQLGMTSQAINALPTLDSTRRAQFEAQNPGQEYQNGAFSLSDLPGVSGAQERLRGFSNSFWSLPVELLVAPQNIFAPGTFIGKGGAFNQGLTSVTDFLGNGVGRATGAGRMAVGGLAGAAYGAATGEDLGDITQYAALGAGAGLILPRAGRALGNPNVSSVATGAILGGAAGGTIALVDDVFGEGESETGYWDAFLGGAAIGAAALGVKSALFKHPGKNRMVGFVSDVMQKSEWKRIAQDEAFTSEFHQALLAGSQEYRDAASRGDGTFIGTWREWKGIDDEATIGGEMMSWITQYAVHRAAKAMVDPADNLGGYLMARDKMIGAMRTFDMENTTDAVIEAAARARVRAEGIDDLWDEEYTRVLELFRKHPDKALEMVGHQNRMSRGFMGQLFMMEDAAAAEGRTGAADFLATLRNDPGAGMDEFASYIASNIDAVGDWSTYSARMYELEDIRGLGLLDGAGFKTYEDPFGNVREVAKKKDRVLASAESRQVDRIMTDELISRDPAVLQSRALQPLGNNDPAGKVVLQKTSTSSAQELAERRDILANYERMYTALEASADARAAGVVTDGLKGMGSAKLKAALKAAGLTDGQSKAVRTIVHYAEANQIPVDDVIRHLDEAAINHLEDSAFWTRSGMANDVRIETSPGASTVLKPGDPAARKMLLKQRQKELALKMRYTAAEVDVDAQVAALREAGNTAAADKLQALADQAAADGYRIVHGVDFVMPSDLAKMDQFHDLTVRHTNAITMGNFFKGKVPAVAHANQERRQRAAISAALTNLGQDAAPESDAVTRVVADLYDIIRRVQDEVAESISSIRGQGILQRTGTRISSMGTPLRIEDMGGAGKKKRLIQALLDKGYTSDEATAIWKAVPKFRNAEFQDVGLYALEAGLRERNQLAGALKWTNRPTIGAIGGAYAGAAVGSSTADENASEAEVRMRQIGFGLLGAAAGVGLQQASKGVQSKVIDWAEQTRYGYIADGLARARDTLRFSLSPFFDLSRYTEGYMLGQAGGPMRYPKNVYDDAGNLVHQAGERVMLPGDISPTGLRRRIARELGGGTEATRAADAKFNQYLSEFRSAARGDFDPQELDSTGRWFAQVGIMGFNPTDWMASAFGEMRRAGFSPDEAYHHARAMYTYGTTGRSAAEMSVNFIVFPFSFQKKAFTHIGTWLNDDLARSWMLHDAFKAYDVLSDEYNLDDVFREHLPVLQQLRRLNMFAYGLSAGQWGGINRRLIEPVVKAGSELSSQLFTPGAYSIGERVDLAGVVSAAELQDMHSALIPAINDLNWMIENSKEQATAVKSGLQGGGWLTSRAQSQQGWSEWNDFRDETQKALQARGFSWQDVYSKDYLSQERLQIDAKRAELAAKYPAWSNSQINATANSAALELERKQRLTAAAANLETATATDFQMSEMETLLDNAKRTLGYSGIEVGGSATWADAPPEVFYAIQEKGRELLAQNPGFNAIWEKFYRPDFGPLEARI